MTVIRIILGPRGRYVLCWLAGLVVTGLVYHLARHAYDTDRPGADPAKVRPDNNYGHVLIDFGGQWVMARMFARGHGPELYNRALQWEIMEEAYPRSDEAPGQDGHDAENLYRWTSDLPPDTPGGPHIGGALYPPTHALLFAPLGRLPPRQAYHLAQILNLALTWLAGAAAAGIARGRLWWPAVTAFLMLFPGYGGAVILGQNSILSLTILLAGWLLVTRGRELAGGAVWGLFAYKPVWAAAFLLVPLLTGRRRMLAGMLTAGVLFGLATLPVVGVRPWLQWLRIGHDAAEAYKADENWVFLSRDLLGIPRRWLLNFAEPFDQRDRPLAAVVGWALWGLVVGTTAAVALARRQAVRATTGYGAAFVCLGAWASCFHFIYYDCLLAALPVLLLLTEPRRFLRPVLLATAPAPPELAPYFAPRPLRAPPPAPAPITAGPRSAAVLNSFVLTAVALLILIEQAFPNLGVEASVSLAGLASNGPLPRLYKFSTLQQGTPWDTFTLLALWAYCGARLLLGSTAPRQVEDRPNGTPACGPSL